MKVRKIQNNTKDFINFLTNLLKKGYHRLPNITKPYGTKVDVYVYKEKISLEEKFDLYIGQCPDNMIIYGYIIECKISVFWYIYWSKKFYKEKQSAIDALNQLNESSRLNNMEFRLIPLFRLNKIELRKYTISKIINN